jgi:uncharacterized protein
MLPDLERVIRLQGIEDAAELARRAIADEPVRQAEFDARLAAVQKALDDAKARLAANQVARREQEKELAMQQGRLSKFKDQLMAVKTNREYQAMQKELEVAQQEIRRHEDTLLELMLEHDELTKHLKTAEDAFKKDKAAIDADRQALATQLKTAEADVARLAAERTALAAQISPQILAMFDRVMRHRKSAAVVPVVDGRCGACQVRLRPQTVNELRKNEIIFQCESCQRVLYYAPGTAPVAPERPPWVPEQVPQD